MRKQNLYSEFVEKGNRCFYFDIRETERGDNYFVLSEITRKKDDDDQRRQILVFENEMDKFGAAFMRTLLHFEMKQKEAKIARIQEAKARYNRAYEPWTKKEDAELALLFGEGKTITEIGEKLQRQPGAIKLRVDKLNLTKAVAAA